MDTKNSNNSRRVTKEQKMCLIQYLEEHSEFAHDRFYNDTGAQSLTDQWSRLASKLNSMGGAMKDGNGWKNAWANIKCKTKQKAQNFKNSLERTGRNIKPKDLSEIDERIIGVMTKVSIVGQTEVSEPLRSAGLVGDVEILQYEENIDVEDIPASRTTLATASPVPDMQTTVEPPRLPSRQPVKRIRMPTLEDTNSKLLQLEAKRLRIEEECLKQRIIRNELLEERNRIERQKAEAISNLANAINNKK